jgi:hypothetical protein
MRGTGSDSSHRRFMGLLVLAMFALLAVVLYLAVGRIVWRGIKHFYD